jgi:hypothetical protein
MSTPPAIYPIITMMGISVISAALVFWLPPRRWVDDGSRTKRWAFRGLLFLAAFLAPCSLVAVGLDLLLRVGSLRESFLTLPFAVRLASFAVPVIATWLIFFRALLKGFQSQPSDVAKPVPSRPRTSGDKL